MRILASRPDFRSRFVTGRGPLVTGTPQFGPLTWFPVVHEVNVDSRFTGEASNG